MAAKKNLVIVESPAKAKTLKKFLGSNYKIEASMGHVRDLPKSELGIDMDNDFSVKYITIRGKGELLAKLRKEVKTANKIYLATDPDREGEAISFHLFYALKLDEATDKKVYRITFNEITKNAVQNSIKEARAIDMDLVDAQQARRVVDRIVGYQISPLLWKKVKKRLSAGRVQSVALKIICDRDDEIENFIPEEYWSIEANLSTNKNKPLKAKFHGKNGKKLEIKSKDEVDTILNNIENTPFTVKEIKSSQKVKNPLPPFTTSTLQQESSKIFNYASSKTMMIAQQLYEGVNIKGSGTVGIVSYIRTDSVRVSDFAYNEAKDFLLNTYGEKYLAKERKIYKSKGKTQDAHEAIRPTDVNRTPDSIKESLTAEQYKIYKLIWERFVASQMSQAIYSTKSIKIDSSDYNFRSTGSILEFDGYLKVYKKNEEKSQEKEKDILLPELEKNEELKVKEIVKNQHFTQPPARYTEASLIKTLEEIGVGRPSTYAPTISTITARNYVTREQKVFYKTELGEAVNDIIKKNFEKVINIGFTAEMEKRLDEIEEGNLAWKEVIRDFYPPFKEMIDEAYEKIENIEIEDEKTDVLCEKCGSNMVVKYGKYGKFLACPKFPECSNTKPFFEDANVPCPECSKKVLIKKTKSGRKFYGCEDNPECSFISWNKPTGDKCPEPNCDGYLVEKGTKNKRICCTNNECGYYKNVENIDNK